MAEKRRVLEESARMLRQRLSDFQTGPVAETDRPMVEVAIQALRQTLTEVGQQLMRLAA